MELSLFFMAASRFLILSTLYGKGENMNIPYLVYSIIVIQGKQRRVAQNGAFLLVNSTHLEPGIAGDGIKYPTALKMWGSSLETNRFQS